MSQNQQGFLHLPALGIIPLQEDRSRIGDRFGSLAQIEGRATPLESGTGCSTVGNAVPSIAFQLDQPTPSHLEVPFELLLTEVVDGYDIPVAGAADATTRAAVAAIGHLDQAPMFVFRDDRAVYHARVKRAIVFSYRDQSASALGARHLSSPDLAQPWQEGTRCKLKRRYTKVPGTFSGRYAVVKVTQLMFITS
jgi:hypothetical protein